MISIERQVVGSFESMLEAKFWSFEEAREYNAWLESTEIRKVDWSEGFREYFNLTNVEGRICIKNPMAKVYSCGPLLLVPTDFVMKALVLGGLP